MAALKLAPPFTCCYELSFTDTYPVGGQPKTAAFFWDVGNPPAQNTEVVMEWVLVQELAIVRGSVVAYAVAMYFVFKR